MPQVIKTQPTGAFTQGGTGIGAVIFDRPQYDPLQVAMQVGNDLDAWAQKKELEAAKKKAESARLIADLNFDDKGAFPDDTDYFKRGAQDLITIQSDLAGKDPNSPQYQQALKNAQLAKNWYQSDVNESTKQWEQYKDAWAKFNPEKHDQDYFNQWNAKVRLARTPRERRELFSESPLKDRIGNFQQMLGERMSKGLYKPSVTEKRIQKDGQWTTESVEEYTDDDIIRNAKSIVNGDKDMVESAQKGLNEMKNTNSLLYDQLLDEAKVLGVDPIELYARKQLKNSVNKKYELKNTAFDPFYEAGAKYEYGKKDTDKAIDFIVEQGGNLLNGKPESYTLGGERVDMKGYPFGGVSYTSGVSKPFISDQFQGWSMGNYTVAENKDGNDQLVSKPNTVLSWMWKDGKPYIKTEETVYKKGQTLDGYKIDEIGFKPASQTDIERLIVANVPKDKVTYALEAYRSKLQKEKAYKERTARPQEMEGQAKKTIGKSGIKDIEVKGDIMTPTAPTSQKQPETKPTEKKAETKREIKKSDIAAKAKAAGYTVSEYTKLLTDKGIKIIE